MSDVTVGWRNEKIGIFGSAGLVGILVVALAAMPAFLAFVLQQWAAGAALSVLCLLVGVLALGRVKERALWIWIGHAILFVFGRSGGRSSWMARAAEGDMTVEEAAELDLPGALQALTLHDGPAMPGARGQRPAVLQHSSGTWAMVAKVEHRGVAMSDSGALNRFGQALGQAVQRVAKSQAGMVRLSLYVRTVPDDGAERAAWVVSNASQDVPKTLQRSAQELEMRILSRATRHDYYVVAVWSEGRLQRLAKASGGGLHGRAIAMYRSLGGLESDLGEAGAESISWLTGTQLAAVIREGFNPGSAMPLAVARAQATSPSAAASVGVSPGAAGPSQAPPPRARSYQHDGYATVAYSLVLPELSTRVGKIRPLLTPAQREERRCLALHFEPMDTKRGLKAVERDTSASWMSTEVRRAKGFRVAKSSERRVRAALHQEERLADGHNLVRVAGAVAVTTPLSTEIETAATLIETSALGAGYELMRLDLAQDTGFVAAVLPVGVGLPRRSA